MDKMGVVYTATRDGWIKRMHKNGSWESWKYIGRDTLLGLKVSSAGHIIVCDAQEVKPCLHLINNFYVHNTSNY